MVYEASFSGVIRIILWILFISFIIRLIARMALPHVMRKAEERMRENAAGHAARSRPPRNEGDVTIESNETKSGNSRGGDYVDYVEIKD